MAKIKYEAKWPLENLPVYTKGDVVKCDDKRCVVEVVFLNVSLSVDPVKMGAALGSLAGSEAGDWIRFTPWLQPPPIKVETSMLAYEYSYDLKLPNGKIVQNVKASNLGVWTEPEVATPQAMTVRDLKAGEWMWIDDCNVSLDANSRWTVNLNAFVYALKSLDSSFDHPHCLVRNINGKLVVGLPIKYVRPDFRNALIYRRNGPFTGEARLDPLMDFELTWIFDGVVRVAQNAKSAPEPEIEERPITSDWKPATVDTVRYMVLLQYGYVHKDAITKIITGPHTRWVINRNAPLRKWEQIKDKQYWVRVRMTVRGLNAEIAEPKSWLPFVRTAGADADEEYISLLPIEQSAQVHPKKPAADPCGCVPITEPASVGNMPLGSVGYTLMSNISRLQISFGREQWVVLNVGVAVPKAEDVVGDKPIRIHRDKMGDYHVEIGNPDKWISMKRYAGLSENESPVTIAPSGR